MDSWESTDAGPEYPTLARIVASAQRRWWLLVVGTLAGAALVFAATGSKPSTYQAETQLLVQSNGDAFSVLRAAGQQAETYATLATSQPVLDATRQRLGLHTSTSKLRADVSAKADSVTRLLTVTAQADRPGEAAAIANSVGAELQRTARAAGGQTGHTLSVVESAGTPSHAVGGSGHALVALGALAGLLGMLTLLVVIDLMRGRVATEDELAGAAPVPVLGSAGRDRASLLGAAALLGHQHRRIAVVGVEEDGTGPASALALASALAAGGQRVLLIDADPSSRGLTRRLRLQGRAGVVEALDRGSGMSRADLAALTVAHGPRVAVMPRGRGTLDPSHAQRLLRRLDAMGDIMVISAPAVLGSVIAMSWTRVADGAVVAARRGHATRDHVAAAVEMLQRSGAAVLGSVLARPLRRHRPPRSVPVPPSGQRSAGARTTAPATTADGASRV